MNDEAGECQSCDNFGTEVIKQEISIEQCVRQCQNLPAADLPAAELINECGLQVNSNKDAEPSGKSSGSKSYQDLRKGEHKIVTCTTQPVHQGRDIPVTEVSPNVLQSRTELQSGIGNVPLFTPNYLTHLLSQSKIGRDILDSSLKGALSIDSKKELASIIANHHISSHIRGTDMSSCRLSRAMLENYVNCIKLRFPAEGNEMIIYYIPATPPERKNPGGAIYQAFKRLKSKKRAREQREIQHTATLATKENNTSPQDAEQSEAIRWLALNNTPWETVLKMWKLTEASRFDKMKAMKPAEIIVKYRHYAEPLGYQLIDEDYHSLGFEEGIQKWSGFMKKLKPYFILKVRDQFSTEVLEHMSRDGITEDTLICCTMILLNCCAKPCKVSKTMRPAILTAQEDVILFAESMQHATDTIRELFASYATQGIVPHPKIVAIGSSYRNITGGFYVVFDQIQYQVNSASRAVDIVIKMCNIMNLPFSKVTKLVWYTVEEVLYNIRAPAQYKEVENIKKLLK